MLLLAELSYLHDLGQPSIFCQIIQATGKEIHLLQIKTSWLPILEIHTLDAAEQERRGLRHNTLPSERILLAIFVL